MKIRNKITFQFTFIVAVLMLLSFVVVYYLFSSARRDGFYIRLSDKIKIFEEVENFEPSFLKDFYGNNNISANLPHEVVWVFNSKNELIFSTNKNADIGFEKPMLDLINSESKGEFREKNYEFYGVKFKEGNRNFVVLIAAKDIYGIRKLKNLGIILLLVFLINLSVMYFIGRFFSARSLKPISNIVNQVNNINIDNINSRIRAGNANDEIAQLADTFNKLLERIENSVTIQKDFITNSSHELRNPLAAITGQLEVALLQERTNGEYKNTLQSVLEDIKRLNQLTNRLLVLSRATNNLTTESFAPVRIDDVLWEARADVIKNHKNYEVLLHFDESIKEERHFIIEGNGQLLKIAFVNLIDNGCKYSDNHKTEIDLSIKNDQLYMIFRDNGIGIPEDEIMYIFEPFYRARNVRKNKGHGIGLSLVEKIVKLHKAVINVVSITKKGTEFQVLFPLS